MHTVICSESFDTAGNLLKTFGKKVLIKEHNLLLVLIFS
jgi:hypothetical protein